ncbi:MAG TPA: M20 family metallo-hydrolase [Dinghuibacter sp.]|uniref:M20 family metallo-hydrolase n=1 Tax=Dinghuibacter sp. TaxID=2024697 RepID=UPI002C0EDC4B|nr:M20 family metallo-hydrolase [Dinghuibacter sp.]HTJ15001.1 M20 family metallo-hydrolase [Dinghuibacter sp.]
MHQLYEDCVALLQSLIRTPSLSREEAGTADLLEAFLRERGVEPHRHLNNVWAHNRHFDPAKPSILLNSHHDTVKPNPQYTRDPFEPVIADGRLYGLGSNDAGGCLVSLAGTFLHYNERRDLTHNLVLALSAEEEISGLNGIEALLPVLPPIEAGIVGEPTKMNLAVAEKGLMVLDCTSLGRAGHAAREEGDSALYKAMDDISWFRKYKFEKESPWLGPVKMSVTVIETENKAHNVVPAVCRYTVDVRVTDAYTHEEVLEIIRAGVLAEVRPRSMRMRATRIDDRHPLVVAGVSLGRLPYGSPTSSDKALMPFPALKCGPGDSARSHTADEFIYLEEIREGIAGYIAMLDRVILK